FGEIGSGSHVVVADELWGRVEEGVSDRSCIQILQVMDTEGDGTAFWSSGAASCGSVRVGVSFDVFVTGSVRGRRGSFRIEGYDPGTMLRFAYDDAAETVAVWSLPPEANPAA